MNELLVRSCQKGPLTLISLPAEIQEAILCQLDCFRILKSAAASCRSFRDLVLYQPGRIVKQILRTSIPDDGFIDDYFESLKKIPRPNLSLSEAVALEDYNRLVNNFARDFARRALSKHPITRVEEKCPWPVTERESYRILRAFYRFELYWKLFQGTEKPRGERHRQLTIPLKDHSKLFFDRFAPWENEQVACIQDFLLRLIDERECLKERILTTLSLVYNDVAAHDVEWGEADIPFNEGYEAGTSTAIDCTI
ncbi:hypothetical protein McanMca71_007868 [Microsporum canis]